LSLPQAGRQIRTDRSVLILDSRGERRQNFPALSSNSSNSNNSNSHSNRSRHQDAGEGSRLPSGGILAAAAAAAAASPALGLPRGLPPAPPSGAATTVSPASRTATPAASGRRRLGASRGRGRGRRGRRFPRAATPSVSSSDSKFTQQ